MRLLVAGGRPRGAGGRRGPCLELQKPIDTSERSESVAPLRSIARRTVRRGNRSAVLVPDWAGFGNQLFYYFHVERLQHSGVDAYAVPSEGAQEWLDHFPAIRDALTRQRSEVRFFDRIDATDWNEMGAFGLAYSREDLVRFVTTYLLSAPMLEHPVPSAQTLTVNVRRGDYYSNPSVRGVLGFDQPAFIAAAMKEYLAVRSAPATISVVSDDPAWCSVRLDFLGEYADELLFNDSNARPIDDFRTVSSATDLIITNSTFSVWAAHIAATRGAGQTLIIAPSFGTRPHSGRWVPLDPEWLIIDDIPGGWDS